jgi:hypothetical protein
MHCIENQPFSWPVIINLSKAAIREESPWAIKYLGQGTRDNRELSSVLSLRDNDVEVAEADADVQCWGAAFFLTAGRNRVASQGLVGGIIRLLR